METVLNFLMDNGEHIAALLFAIHALALAIVNFTPTPRGNEIVMKFYKPIEFLAGILSRKAKQ